MDRSPASHASGSPGHSDHKVYKAHSLSTALHGVHSLNPRSCVTCRKRKVKCDKKHPCTNCSKANIECIFPPPGRAPRKTRKPPDGELLARLRRLEGVVKSLGGSAEPDHERQAAPAPLSVADDGSYSSTENRAPVDWEHLRSSLDSRFGRLVVEDGRSRYVNGSFWASLSNEVEDLKGILNEASEEEEDEDYIHSPASVSSGTATHQGFIFNLSSLASDLHSLHPPPNQVMELFDIYVSHVDPLVKMLHIPTTRKLVESVKDNPGRAPKGLEALLFSIYYSSITAISDEECHGRGWGHRSEVLARYRFAIEQALARANFLITDELIVLQAFIIFLMCLRRNEDARVIWTLTGLVMRMATVLGLHRDGSYFGLTPFEIDMRRRTFWQIFILDIRASEDQGCDTINLEHGYDTQFPLNVNDEDLYPDMKEAPESRVGFTEMTWSLIRHEVGKTLRRINNAPTCASSSMGVIWPEVTLEEKERLIGECHRTIEDKYLKYCNMNEPIQWVTATISRLIMAKMWLIVYHPFHRLDGGASLPQDTKDRLFITSLECIEFALLLESEARTVKWGWLFKSYVQWHALAFILSELCVRTRGLTVQRAWRALDAFLTGWGGQVGVAKKNSLWRPLQKLIAKARAARQAALKGEANPNENPKQEPEESPKALSPTQLGTPEPSDVSFQGNAGADTAGHPNLKPSTDAFMMPAGTDAPAMLDPYLDQTADNSVSCSQFFAAQPAPTPMQIDQVFRWQSNQAGYRPTGGEWFPGGDIGSSSIGNDTKPISSNPTFPRSSTDGTFTAEPSNLQNNMPQIDPSLFAIDGTNAPGPDGFGDPAGLDSAYLQPGLIGDPMVGDATGASGMQWSEWDDMVREFQLEQGGGTSYNRRPLLGETWL